MDGKAASYKPSGTSVRNVRSVRESSDNQIIIDVFDGAMIISALCCLNFFHPGRLLGPWTSLSHVDSIDENMLKKKGYA